MSLTPADFARVAKTPRSALSVLSAQLLLLPLAGFSVAFLLDLPPALAVGLVLLASCPGGTTSNLFSYIARANVALSISLTAVAGAVTTVTIPLWVNGALAVFGRDHAEWQFPVLRTIATLFLFTLLPVFIGMTIRYWFPRFAQKSQAWVSRLSLGFILLLTVGLIYWERDMFMTFLPQIGMAVIVLNAAAVLAGWSFAYFARLNFADTSTSIIEVGIQNSAMAIVIATAIIQDPEIAMPASVYSASMYLFGFAVVAARRKRGIEEASAVFD